MREREKEVRAREGRKEGKKEIELAKEGRNEGRIEKE